MRKKREMDVVFALRRSEDVGRGHPWNCSNTPAVECGHSMKNQSHDARIEARKGWLPVTEGELYFECAGDGEPVAFLHGFGLDSRMWGPQSEAFSPAFCVIRYDLRGFGRSSPPPDCDYAHEDDLTALLSHLGVKSAHIVGLSMGGRMALRFAAAHPEMVRSLVLADSALDGYTWSDDWQSRWTAMCTKGRADRVSEAKRLWLGHPLFDSARDTPSCGPLLSKMIDDYSGWHWKQKDRARMPSPPLAERLQDICTPSLVITGSRDILDFQAIGKLLEDGLPRARREVIEGAGHMVNLERAESFNKLVLKFWGENLTAP